MTPRSPGAFILSTAFHALIIGGLFLYAYIVGGQQKEPTRVLELVAGEGDNYGATVAPKLGTPGGIKVDVPAIPVPKAEPKPEPVTPPEPPKPEPVQKETAPITPAPTPPPKPTPAPAKKPDQTVPNFAKQILRKAWAADARAKKEVAKERAAEEKRLKKEEFDRQQRAKIASAKSGAAPKVSHIDGEGIAKGVVGGSTENKVGGAGGKALVANEGAVTERYYALLKQRVMSALEKPPGVSDDLVVTIVVTIHPNGRLTGAHVTQSSGSDEFDRAVIAAFNRVDMPDHPEHKTEELELSFRTTDASH